MKNLFFITTLLVSSMHTFSMQKEQDDLKIDLEKCVVNFTHTSSHEEPATDSKEKKIERENDGDEEVKKACNTTKAAIITAIGTLVTVGVGLTVGLTQK